MKMASIEDACVVVTDGTHYTPPDVGEGVPFLTVKDISDQGLDFTGCSYITLDEYIKADLGNSSPKVGDVLFSKDGTVGKVHVVSNNREFAVLSSIAILRPRLEVLDSQYFGHILRSPLTLDQAIRRKTGSAIRRIILKDLKQVQIPLPPLEEQRRIAAILDKADAVRRKRQSAIALTEELLRSAFLEMFGDPITNPKGWSVVDLKSQIAELRYGTSVKCNDVKEDGDLPILRIPNIVGEQISWNDLKYAELEAKEVTKLLLKPGDLLFVRTNGNPEYIGRCALFEEGYSDTLYASYLIRARLKPNAQLYPAFIRDTISFPTYRSHLVREARTTAGNYNINTEGLGRLHLIKPPLKEQEIYIQFGQELNAQVEKQKRQLKETNTLFNSLLQSAFRGEL